MTVNIYRLFITDSRLAGTDRHRRDAAGERFGRTGATIRPKMEITATLVSYNKLTAANVNHSGSYCWKRFKIKRLQIDNNETRRMYGCSELAQIEIIYLRLDLFDRFIHLKGTSKPTNSPLTFYFESQIRME